MKKIAVFNIFFRDNNKPLKIYELNIYGFFLSIRVLLAENYNDSFFNSSHSSIRFLCQ